MIYMWYRLEGQSVIANYKHKLCHMPVTQRQRTLHLKPDPYECEGITS